jgi:hypothetical protein
MIYVCSFCGHSLDSQLKDGLIHCSHCNRIIESSPFNRLLAGAWMIRRHHYSAEQLQAQANLSEEEAIFLTIFIGDHCYTHDDFVLFLTKLGVSNKSY